MAELQTIEEKCEALQSICNRTLWADCLDNKCPLDKYCKTQEDPMPFKFWQAEKIEQAYAEAVRCSAIKKAGGYNGKA